MIFFLDSSIIDAKLLLDAFKKGEPSLHGWPDKQISDVSATFQHFYFDQQSVEDSTSIPEVRTF